MQAHSSAKTAEPSRPPPFFAVQPQREPFFSPSEFQPANIVQRQCSTCDAKEKLNRQAESTEEESPRTMGEEPAFIQRKCSACDKEEKLSRQAEGPDEQSATTAGASPSAPLRITPPDDPQEHEADQVAAMVMRMPATDAGHDGMAAGGGGDISRASEPAPPEPGAIHAKCDECSIDKPAADEQAEDVDPFREKAGDKAGGAGLPDAGADADADAGGGDAGGDASGDGDTVSPKSEPGEAPSVPGGMHAALRSSRGAGRPLPPGLRQSMESRFGQDFSAVRIHSNSASAAMAKSIHAQAFTYGSDIFFNPHRYDPASVAGQTLLAHELTHVVQQKGAHPLQRKIQRSDDGARMGNWAHSKIQDRLRSRDDHLITEAGVPGSNRHDRGINVVGYADLYKSEGSKMSGVRATISGAAGDVIDVKYTYKNFMLGGKRVLDIKSKSPYHFGPRLRGKTWDYSTNLPKTFEIGELKPLFPTEFTESVLYHGSALKQLRDYIDGFEDFARQLRKDQGAPPVTASTSGKPIDIPDGKIPDAINYKKFLQERDKKGPGTILKKETFLKEGETTPRVWIYQFQPGAFVYFLISHPYSSAAFRPGLDDQLKKLSTIKTDLRKDDVAKIPNSIDSKREPGAPKISRKDEDWSKKADAWEKKRKAWVNGDGKTAKPKKFLKEQAKGIEKKTKVDKKLGLRADATEQKQAKGVKDIRFWSSFKGRIFGALYFRFRKVFLKIEEFFAKLKAKFKKHRDKAEELNKKNGIFDDWKKVATQVIIRMAVEIFKEMVAIAFTGFMNCINAIIESIVGKYVEKIQNEAAEELKQYEPLCCGIMEFKHKFDAEVEKHEQVIKEFTEAIETFRKWQSILSDVEIAVRVGVEVVSCGLPPGLGCLWGLVAQVGISTGLSLLTRTSYFDDYIARPAANAIMDTIVGDKLHNLMIDALELTPLKDAMQGLGPCSRRVRGAGGFGAGTQIGGHLDKLDPNDPAIVKAREEWEAQHKDAILKDLQDVFEKGDKTPMTEAEIQQLVDALKKSKKTPAELKKMMRVGRNPKSGKYDFNKAVAQVSSDVVPEETTEPERKIDYKKAGPSNAYYEQKIGWQPTTFVKLPGIKADSKEFADAVYDMQKATGAFADGIAGPGTTVKFYEENKLPKDATYDKATKVGEQEAKARADKQARAARRKELEALFKEPAIKAALEKPFPSHAQLKKDLLALSWDRLENDSMQFIKRNGNVIVGIKTSKGGALGAYVNTAEREFLGQKMPMVVVTSDYYVVEEVPKDDLISNLVTLDDGSSGLELIGLKPRAKDTFFEMDPIFFGRFVEIL